MSANSSDSNSTLMNSRWMIAKADTPDPFPSTRWTLVGRAKDSGQALNDLCCIYWYPLYAYVRRKTASPEDAEDLTQSYLARLLERGYLERAEKQKGKFRAFLLADLKLFLAREWVRGRAVKRGGRCVIESFDHAMAEQRYGVEPVDHDSPEKLFDRAWATTLLEQVRQKLRRYYEVKGPDSLKAYEVLQPFIAWNAGEQPYAESAAVLGVTVNHLKVDIHRMRKRYRSLLEKEIADTVTSKEEIQEELNALAAAFAG
jgi:RNA polymerase sigma-70 factor (ECF subfamily)